MTLRMIQFNFVVAFARDDVGFQWEVLKSGRWAVKCLLSEAGAKDKVPAFTFLKNIGAWTTNF